MAPYFSDIPLSAIPRNVLRERLIAAVVLGALTLLVYGDVLLRFDQTVISDPRGDTSQYFAPFRAFGFGELARGNLALWNPHVFSGAPFMGGFQSALLYPPNLIYLVLPLALALNLDICAHTFLLGMFTFLWVWPRTRRFEPAILAGALLMFSGPYALRVLAGELTMLSSLAYTPLLLYAVDRVFDRVATRTPALGPVLLGIAATSLQILAGSPGTVFLTAFTIAVYIIVRLVGAPRRISVVLPFAAIAIVPVGITAMQLWLGAEATAESIRAGGGSFDFAASFSFPIENLITLVAPGFFGDSISTAYWGRWNFWDVSLFIGVTSCIFAVAGVLWGRGRGGATALGLALLILLVAFGRYTPLFEVLYNHVPGFRSFRAPSKFLFFVTLFIALAAGLGFDALLENSRRARWLGWGAITLAVALGAGMTGVLIAHSTGSDGSWAQMIRSAKSNVEVYMWVEATDAFFAQAARSAVWSLALAGGVAFGVGVLLILAPRRPRMIWAVAAGGLIELIVFSRVYRQTFTLDQRRPEIDKAYAACTDGERVIDMGRFDGRVRNYAVKIGGRAVWGYDPVILKRYGEFVCFAAGGAMRAPELHDEVFTFSSGTDPFGSALNHGFNNFTETGFKYGGKFYALLRPRFIVRAPVPAKYRDFVLYHVKRSGAIDSNAQDTDAPFTESVYEIPVYYPEFFLASQYVVKPATTATLNDLVGSKINFAATAVLEEEPDPAPSGVAPNGGTVKVVDRSTDHFTFHVESPANALMMITHSYSTGWRAVPLEGSVQQNYRVLPADYTLMAVPLSAGVHNFRLEYSPAGYRYGRWISLVSFAGYLAALAFWARRNHRARPTARQAGSP